MPDDGLLDVVVVEERGLLARIGLAPRLFDRTIDKAAGVTMFKGTKVTVTGPGPLAFHVDGEPHAGGTTVSARVYPAALRVKVPQGA